MTLERYFWGDECGDSCGFAYEFHVTPDVGHWYPDDLAERIDLAIAHIRGGGDQD